MPSRLIFDSLIFNLLLLDERNIKLTDSDIRLICENLFDAFRGILSWKWDDWVGTILAEFEAERSAEIRTLLGKFLPVSYDSGSMKDAPAIVQSIDKNLGGLRSGQLLFSSDPAKESFVFCAWWPWGNGKTVSIRIAPFDKHLSPEEESQLVEQLKKMAEI